MAVQIFYLWVKTKNKKQKNYIYIYIYHVTKIYIIKTCVKDIRNSPNRFGDKLFQLNLITNFLLHTHTGKNIILLIIVK